MPKSRSHVLASFMVLAAAMLLPLVPSCGASMNARVDASSGGPADASASADGSPDDECLRRLAAFAPYADLVEVSCGPEYLHVHSETGLPWLEPAEQFQRAMVGITRWILRVPVPSDYPWRIPLEPVWTGSIVEASPRGPIAMAVNGVPIFHYEARPDVSTHPDRYDPRSDTVVLGELDHCGGHAGQGEDYHYHYAPVCLLDAHDLSQPIGYGLDGAPIYFGTGGTDYYGDGRYNEIDNLPDEELDLCNALRLPGGGYAHFTTAEPPYVIGCHHGVVAPELQIEPRPMRDQGTPGPYGGTVGEGFATLITGFSQDPDGWFQLEHTAFGGMGTSAIRYRRADAGEDCWDFEFRESVDTPGTMETYCRPR